MTFTAHPTRLQLRPFFFFIHCILYFVLHFCRLLFLLCLFVLCAVAGIRLVCLVGIQKPLLEHLYIPMMNPAECFHPEKKQAGSVRVSNSHMCVVCEHSPLAWAARCKYVYVCGFQCRFDVSRLGWRPYYVRDKRR